MMDDLIRRSDALEAFAESTSAMPEKQGRRRIEEIPAVDAVEVRHGRWIECEDATLDVYYKCSACGNEWDIIEGTPEDNNMKYCPECGARMDGEEEHNATD